MKPPTEAASPWIRFLHDCYEADNRETAIFDLRDAQVTHLHFLRHGGAFLEGTLDCVPLGREIALAARKTARLYETEKTLVFCAFLLEGAWREAGSAKPRPLLAPLMFFPATVEETGERAVLRVDAREQRINTRLLAALLGDGEPSSTDLDEIVRRIPPIPIERHQVQALMDVFSEFLPAVDTSELVQFPHGVAVADAVPSTQPAARTEGRLRCRPAWAMAVVPNSPDTRSVLTELTQLASRPDLSAPLRALFGCDAPPAGRASPPSRPHVPAALSAAQQHALRSAAAHPLTLIIGPPGTGKSYTVAAAAVDHVLRGQSVLVTAKTAQALDVIADKIETLAGGRQFLLRGGRSGYTRQLQEGLNHWLSEGVPQPDAKPTDATTVRRCRREVASRAVVVARLESLLERRAEWEVAWGSCSTDRRRLGFLRRCLRGCQLRLTEWQLSQQDFYWDLMEHYQGQLALYQAAVAAWLRASLDYRVAHLLQRHRGELTLLSRALRSRTSRKKQEWFAQSNIELLLQTFPIWMATLTDLGGLLPFGSGLFDLAIVDEATQCDMASALPALFRARRAVITGDPRQLRHLSFLSRERQRLLAAKWQRPESDLEVYDYRDRSLLDLVNDRLTSQNQVAFLDEHFRSRPGIIAFSNRQFYRGRLKIMTDRPTAVRPPCIILRQVNGRRAPGQPNRQEAEQVVDEIARRVAAERHLPAGVAHTFGVLSPFREQVDFLHARLSERLSLEAVEKHRLRVGTAHSFQGEERDLMLLSLAVDDQAHPGSLRYLQRPDVFNVAITRARDLQIVFSSVTPGRLPHQSLLRSYLETAAALAPPTPAASADTFLREVSEALTARGVKTWPAYVVAGMPIDLLAEKSATCVGIDLIGSPGRWATAFDLEKYRLLQRAGLRLLPLPLSAWRKDRQTCLNAVERWLGEQAESDA